MAVPKVLHKAPNWYSAGYLFFITHIILYALAIKIKTLHNNGFTLLIKASLPNRILLSFTIQAYVNARGFRIALFT